MVMPLLALLVFGAVGLARLANVSETLHNACREGARYSAMPVVGSNALPGVGEVVQRVVNFAAADDITLNPLAVSVSQEVDQTVNGLTTSYSDVQVVYHFKFMLPLLTDLVPSVTLSPQAEMRNEIN